MNITEEIKEAMEEKCRPVDAGTAQNKTNEQYQYSYNEGEIQEEIQKILGQCLDAKKTGTDCFFNYSPHVNHISVRVFTQGWSDGASPIYLETYLADSTEALRALNRNLWEILRDAHGTILSGGDSE